MPFPFYPFRSNNVMTVYVEILILENRGKKTTLRGVKLSYGFNVFDESWTFERRDSKHVRICRPDDGP